MGKGTGQPEVTAPIYGVRLASVPAGVLMTLIVCAAAGL